MFKGYAVQVLQVVADEIEKQRGYFISKYVMIYTAKEHALKFQLNDETEKLPLNEPALADGIKSYIETEIPAGYTLDFALIFFDREKGCQLTINIENPEGEKKSETIKL